MSCWASDGEIVCSVSQQFQRSTTSYGDAATVKYEPKDRVRVHKRELGWQLEQRSQEWVRPFSSATAADSQQLAAGWDQLLATRVVVILPIR